MGLTPKAIEDGEDEMSEEKNNGSRDENDKDKDCEEAAKEEDPINKTPGKLKKEMAKQKAYHETKKQKLEDVDAKTLLIKNLPDKVTHHELKEVFEDSFQIRLVNKDGMSKRIAYIEFKSQADAERALEEKQGIEIHGLAIILDHTGEKNQGPGNRGGKSCPWRVGKRKMEQESHAFQEKWERAYFFVEALRRQEKTLAARKERQLISR
ncbi:nucleolin-like isoform X2 [Tamandua tetradactyla]|uniref:nucleolin-like isoform X2 n=1 Tax=Tamandua tetradactyla TaxID=48850 RepID=UPI004053CA3B